MKNNTKCKRSLQSVSSQRSRWRWCERSHIHTHFERWDEESSNRNATMRGTPPPAQHWTTQVPPVNGMNNNYKKEVEEESINQSINQSRYDAQSTQHRNFFFFFSGTIWNPGVVGRWEGWGSKHGFRLQKEENNAISFFLASMESLARTRLGRTPPSPPHPRHPTPPHLYNFFFFSFKFGAVGDWGGVQTGKQLQFDSGAGLGSGCVRV